MAVMTPGVPVVGSDPTLSVEGLAAGVHRFRLEVEDEAGNRSVADEREVLVRAPVPVEPVLPVITSLQPGWGNWGDAVQIVGTGFDPVPDKNQPVFSAAVAAAVASTSSTTQLAVRVPQPAVTGPVTVRTGNGVATSPRPFIVPRSFVMQARGSPLFDLAAEPARNEIWALHGVPGALTGLVSMLSLERRRVVAVLEVQSGAREIAISGRERARAAVSNGGASTVSIIDVSTRRLISHVRVSAGPAGLAFQPGGTVLYVACAGSATAAVGTVDVISVLPSATAAPRVIARIELQRGPARVVFSPDGKLAFVNEVGSGTVAMIDTSAHRVVNRFKVGGDPGSAPSEVAVSANTFPLLVANPGTRNCSVVDGNFNVRDIDLGVAVAGAAIDGSDGSDGTGGTGGTGWLTGPDEALLFALDLGTLRPRKVQAAGTGAAAKSIVLVPAGARTHSAGIVAASPGAAAASVVEPKSRRLQAAATQTDRPQRTVLSADGNFAVFIGPQSPAVTALELGSVLPV